MSHCCSASMPSTDRISAARSDPGSTEVLLKDVVNVQVPVHFSVHRQLYDGAVSETDTVLTHCG